MSPNGPPILCIIGPKNAGKTEITVALGAELNRRGHKVMTVKHGHGFQVDHPGRDSWRHRHEGGAGRTVLASPAGFAVIGDWPQEEMPLSELVFRFLSDADIVLAEGFKDAPEPKVEVFRDAHGRQPLSDADLDRASRTIALVTDRTDLQAPIPVFRLGDPDSLARLTDFLEEKLLRTRDGTHGRET